MSISSEIERISSNVSGAFTAISTKGGTVPAGAISDNLAAAIATIPAAAEPYVEYVLSPPWGQILGAKLKGFTNVPFGMFNDSSIKTVDFTGSPNLTEIGPEAFMGSELNISSLPNSVTIIGNSAFEWCYHIRHFVLHSGITSIGLAAFGGLDNLRTFEIGCNLGDNFLFNFGDGADQLDAIWIRNTCTNIYATSNSYPFLRVPSTTILYVEAPSKPDGFGDYFNNYSSSEKLTTIYGVTQDPFNNISVTVNVYYIASGLCDGDAQGLPQSITSSGSIRTLYDRLVQETIMTSEAEGLGYFRQTYANLQQEELIDISDLIDRIVHKIEDDSDYTVDTSGLPYDVVYKDGVEQAADFDGTSLELFSLIRAGAKELDICFTDVL